MNHDILYAIALTKIPLVGPIIAKELIAYTGSAEAVFKESGSKLVRIPGVGPRTAEAIATKKSLDLAESELQFIQSNDIDVFYYLEERYPFRLKRLKDAPILMYARGEVDLNSQRMLSIVGTRKPSPYGLQMVERFISELAVAKPTIISGLAYGVDITAHRLALKYGLPTIAVMGTGLDRIYPASHRNTASKIIQSGGLLTEFGHHTEPNRENFPMRNRIIAGLCDAILIVESKHKGGSMISAEMANVYHKDVFAIPGRIGDDNSVGCNYLIHTNKATIAYRPSDLMDTMGWNEIKPMEQTVLFEDLSTSEKRVFDLLDSKKPVSIDLLYKSLSMSSSELASALLQLEFKGQVRVLPGKQYLKSI